MKKKKQQSARGCSICQSFVFKWELTEQTTTKRYSTCLRSLAFRSPIIFQLDSLIYTNDVGIFRYWVLIDWVWCNWRDVMPGKFFVSVYIVHSYMLFKRILNRCFEVELLINYDFLFGRHLSLVDGELSAGTGKNKTHTSNNSSSRTTFTARFHANDFKFSCRAVLALKNVLTFNTRQNYRRLSFPLRDTRSEIIDDLFVHFNLRKLRNYTVIGLNI